MAIKFSGSAFLTLCVIPTLIGTLGSESVVQPEDHVALPGDKVRFNCITDIPDEVTLDLKSAITGEKLEIYYGAVLVDALTHRYRVDSSKKGQHTLIIERVDKDHAGVYECRDDDGLGNPSKAELTVLEAHPACIAIETNDTSAQDEFFNCSVISYGNLEPNITCGGGASNVTISASHIDGSRMQTITVTASQARTCRVCFLPSSQDEEPLRCVFNSTFAGIPTPSMAGQDTLLVLKQMSAIEEAKKNIFISVSVIVVCLVIIVAVVIFLSRGRRCRQAQVESKEPFEVTDDSLKMDKVDCLISGSFNENKTSEYPINSKEHVIQDKPLSECPNEDQLRKHGGCQIFTVATIHIANA